MPLAERLAGLDAGRLHAELDARGFALTGPLLGAHDCAALAALYDDDARFRSRVVMAAHGFGRGEYRYFAYPLPPVVEALRRGVYPALVPIADAWADRLGEPRPPATLDGLHAACRAAGQERPTPLLLRYGEGDENCLHQDLYGAVAFPLQLAVLLSAPGADFDGGEFVLTEQRPRMQSRVEVVPLARGEGVVFAVSRRPVAGRRGDHRVVMRHGVSRIRRGRRLTLGVIFHEAA
jgi:hypothetical protein